MSIIEEFKLKLMKMLQEFFQAMTSKQVILIDFIFGETIEDLGISCRLLVPLVSGRSLFNAIPYYWHHSFAYISLFDKFSHAHTFTYFSIKLPRSSEKLVKVKNTLA